MDMEVEDIRNGREGQGHTKHANIKKRKMSMTTNNIQEFRNATEKIHRIKENIDACQRYRKNSQWNFNWRYSTSREMNKHKKKFSTIYYNQAVGNTKQTSEKEAVLENIYSPTKMSTPNQQQISHWQPKEQKSMKGYISSPGSERLPTKIATPRKTML